MAKSSKRRMKIIFKKLKRRQSSWKRSKATKLDKQKKKNNELCVIYIFKKKYIESEEKKLNFTELKR